MLNVFLVSFQSFVVTFAHLILRNDWPFQIRVSRENGRFISTTSQMVHENTGTEDM